jgi:hypothetical protein
LEDFHRSDLDLGLLSHGEEVGWFGFVVMDS